VLGEHHTTGSKPVDVWSAESLLTVTAQIGVTKIVGNDIDNVWRMFFVFIAGTGYKSS